MDPKGNGSLIATFCHVDQNQCPQLFQNEGAEPGKAFSIKDDFGNAAHMSREQLGDLINQAKSGALDAFV